MKNTNNGKLLKYIYIYTHKKGSNLSPNQTILTISLRVIEKRTLRERGGGVMGAQVKIYARVGGKHFHREKLNCMQC